LALGGVKIPVTTELKRERSLINKVNTREKKTYTFAPHMQVGIRHFQRVEQKVEALTVGHPRFRLIKFIEAVVPVDLDLVVQDAITSPSYQVQQLAHLLLGQKSIKQMQFDQLWSTQHLKNTVI